MVPEWIRGATALVVGVGAGGRPVAITLTAMGIGKIILVDGDEVDTHNCAVQGYSIRDVEYPKVSVLARTLEKIHNTEQQQVTEVIAKAQWFGKKEGQEFPEQWWIPEGSVEVVFACADDMDARKAVFEWACGGGAGLFVDGRMIADAMRILTIPTASEVLKAYYRTTLFRNEDVVQAPCTLRATMYGSLVVAGLMVNGFAKWARGQTGEQVLLYPDVQVNLMTLDVHKRCRPIELGREVVGVAIA
jgi:molybdopterin-synthase adenylyltransferase